MQQKKEFKEDFYRAVYLLEHRFNTPTDLLKYWAFSGPCSEKYPSIEKIKNFDE